MLRTYKDEKAGIQYHGVLAMLNNHPLGNFCFEMAVVCNTLDLNFFILGFSLSAFVL